MNISCLQSCFWSPTGDSYSRILLSCSPVIGLAIEILNSKEELNFLSQYRKEVQPLGDETLHYHTLLSHQANHAARYITPLIENYENQPPSREQLLQDNAPQILGEQYVKQNETEQHRLGVNAKIQNINVRTRDFVQKIQKQNNYFVLSNVLSVALVISLKAIKILTSTQLTLLLTCSVALLALSIFKKYYLKYDVQALNLNVI